MEENSPGYERISSAIPKLEAEIERLQAIQSSVEKFVRVVHCDGDSDIDWQTLPDILSTIADLCDSGRDALAIVDKLLLAIDEVGVGLFGPDVGLGSWRDAQASWWQSLLKAVAAAQAAKGE